MSPAPAVAVAVVFVWLGLVLGISFLEAPLKFRAPGVTTRIGLGIGRLVFRALNLAEVGLALALLVAVAIAGPSTAVVIGAVIVVTVLAVQLVAVRPGLTRRSDLILAGQDAPHSRGHVTYIGLELVKVIALLTTGILLFS